jgi:hypothetical protein
MCLNIWLKLSLAGGHAGIKYFHHFLITKKQNNIRTHDKSSVATVKKREKDSKITQVFISNLIENILILWVLLRIQSYQTDSLFFVF